MGLALPDGAAGGMAEVSNGLPGDAVTAEPEAEGRTAARRRAGAAEVGIATRCNEAARAARIGADRKMALGHARRADPRHIAYLPGRARGFIFPQIYLPRRTGYGIISFVTRAVL